MTNESSSTEQNWVLAVGSDIPKEYPCLPAAFNDANDIYHLISNNWQCELENKILLTGNEATTKNINATLNELLVRRAKEKDKVLIYLSGHIEPDIRGITGAFVTKDYAKTSKNYGVNLRSLRYLVEDSLAKYVLVIIDGCYSGLIAQGIKTATPHWFYFTTGEMDSDISTKLFITAVSSEQTFQRETSRNSNFTEVIISIISESLNKNESLSTGLFFDKLSKKTTELGIGTPVKSGVEVGYTNFIFSENNKEISSNSKSNGIEIPLWLSKVLIESDLLVVNEEDLCSFVKDNNLPDGSDLRIGEKVVKSWRIRNAGKVVWRNRFFKMHGQSRGAGLIQGQTLTPIPEVLPGQEIDIEIELQMPPYPSLAYAEFKMVDVYGNYLFPNRKGLYLHVNVRDL